MGFDRRSCDHKCVHGSGRVMTSRHTMRAPEPERWPREKLEKIVTMPWGAMFEDGGARTDETKSIPAREERRGDKFEAVLRDASSPKRVWAYCRLSSVCPYSCHRHRMFDVALRGCRARSLYCYSTLKYSYSLYCTLCARRAPPPRLSPNIFEFVTIFLLLELDFVLPRRTCCTRT